MLESLGVLLLLTVLGWAFFMYTLKPHFGFSFIHTPVRTFGYFAVLAAVIAYLYIPVAAVLFIPSVSSIASLVAVLVFINPLLYRDARKKATSREGRFHHPDLELLEVNNTFLFSKIADVIFQQTVAGILILMLHAYGLPMFWLVLLFALIFAFGHIGLLTRMPLSWAYYFSISALVGGAGLPFLILYTPGGVYYAIAFHMLWYVGSGFLFSLYEDARMRTPHTT